jgi:hypothetical protein
MAEMAMPEVQGRRPERAGHYMTVGVSKQTVEQSLWAADSLMQGWSSESRNDRRLQQAQASVDFLTSLLNMTPQEMAQDGVSTVEEYFDDTIQPQTASRAMQEVERIAQWRRERRPQRVVDTIQTSTDLPVPTGTTPPEETQQMNENKAKGTAPPLTPQQKLNSLSPAVAIVPNSGRGGESGDENAPMKHTVPPEIQKDFFGYSDWLTGHTALLIDNTESTYNSKRNLAKNALKKKIGIDQLAGQFSRLFRKQYMESVKFYEDNAADARDQRGAYERHQLEGTQPASTGNPLKDTVKEVVNDFWYGPGRIRDWEQPMGECDWRAIAQNAIHKEPGDAKANDALALQSDTLNLSEDDKKMLTDMGIKA